MYNIYTGFSQLGEWGESPQPTKNLFILLLPTKFLFPPNQKSILPNIKKTVIFSCSHCSCSFHFCFDFILFWNRDHANFDFNWCSIFTSLVSVYITPKIFGMDHYHTLTYWRKSWRGIKVDVTWRNQFSKTFRQLAAN